MESFVDPRLFKDISYNRSPLAKELEKYLGDHGFSYIKSPIYGGGTAQAEFEILTGIRALGKIDSVDFNTLKGEKMSGFISSISQAGYQTYASIATSSEYFNSISAYGSIGLKHLEFLEETPNYKPKEGDAHIFDGDLFDYNIQRIKTFPIDKPYVFYTLGMYGHIPYQRNKIRPSIIFPSSKDHRIKRIANQFYFRTKALAKYIDQILALDPSAIIYVSSDHLPSILNSGIRYKKDKKYNIALLLIDGKNVPIDGLKYYQVPRYLWQILHSNHQKFKNIYTKKEEKSFYFKVLSESIKHH
jgi:phosphoglycerol transferase MdoB-like AlkP superfamily enzyme